MKKIAIVVVLLFSLFTSSNLLSAQTEPLSVQVLDFCYEDESGRCLLAILPQGGVPPYRFHLPDGRIIEGYVYQRVLAHLHEYPFSVSDAAGQLWSYQYTNNCVGHPPALPEIQLNTTLVQDSLVQMYQAVAMPITATHFNQVKDAKFVLDWAGINQPDSIVWNSRLNINPSQYRLGLNELSVYWFNAQGVTIPPDQALAVVWFSAQDSVPDCSMRFSVRHILNTQDQQLQLDQVLHRRVHPQLTPDCIVHIDTVRTHSYAEVCVPFVVEQLEKLLGFQMTILYDTSLLRYTRAELMLHGAPNLGPLTNHDARGAINFIWIGDGSTAMSKAAGETLLDVCFEPRRAGTSTIRVPSGVSAPIGSAFDTLPPEAVSSWLQEIPFLVSPGVVEVVPDTYVYPGDADANGIVNHYDLLYLGLATGLLDHQRGPRPPGTTDWAPQLSLDWGKETPNSHINLCHADADGSGNIDANDVAVWQQNDGLYHPAWAGDDLAHPLPPPSSTAPAASLYVRTNPILPGQAEVSFPIMLGESAQPVQDAYGLAFSIYYDPELVLPGSMTVDFDNSWLATTTGTLPSITVARDMPQEGRIDIAISRQAGPAADEGYGTIGQLRWTPLLPAGARQMAFRPDHALLLTAAEEAIPVSAQASEAILLGAAITSVGEQAHPAPVRLYPNPVQETLFIDSPASPLAYIECWSSTGQLLHCYAPTAQISTAALPAGVYWFRLYTPSGLQVQRVVKR